MRIYMYMLARTHARSYIIYVHTICANERSNDTQLVDLVRGLSERGVELISTGGTAGLVPEPSRRCADGCGNGRCNWAGTDLPRWYRWIRNKPWIPGSAWASPSTCSPPCTASRADRVAGWSPGRWLARARCSSVYIKLTQVMPCPNLT